MDWPGAGPTGDAATAKGARFVPNTLPLPLPCRDHFFTAKKKILEYIWSSKFAPMVVGRKKPAPRVAEEGGPVRPGVKGKNFCKDEEEQLCRSVFTDSSMAVTSSLF